MDLYAYPKRGAIRLNLKYSPQKTTLVSDHIMLGYLTLHSATTRPPTQYRCIYNHGLSEFKTIRRQ